MDQLQKRLDEISQERTRLLKRIDELNEEEAHLTKIQKTVDVDPSTLHDDLVFNCRDQNGCRVLQQKLESGSDEERESIIEQTLLHVRSMAADQYGNYLVQKVLEKASPAQIESAIDGFANDAVEIASNMHGTRVLQKLIDVLPQHAWQRFISAITPAIPGLSKDINGSHVVQRMLAKFGPEEKHEIYCVISKNCLNIAMSRQGCCTVQRVLEHANPEIKEEVYASLTANVLELIQDPFANYVIQFIIDQNDERRITKIIRQMLHNIASLACNKFSSNVVEKCLRAASSDVRQLIIDEITEPQTLPRLVQDGFANYVVQTALTMGDESQYQQIVDALRPCVHLLRNSPYGSRIEAKMHRRTQRAHNRTQGGHGHGNPHNQRDSHSGHQQQQQQSQHSYGAQNATPSALGLASLYGQGLTQSSAPIASQHTLAHFTHTGNNTLPRARPGLPEGVQLSAQSRAYFNASGLGQSNDTATQQTILAAVFPQQFTASASSQRTMTNNTSRNLTFGGDSSLADAYSNSSPYGQSTWTNVTGW